MAKKLKKPAGGSHVGPNEKDKVSPAKTPERQAQLKPVAKK
jgi:hypothetical protein